MRLLVDTGEFSAAPRRRRQPEAEPHVALLVGQQLFSPHRPSPSFAMAPLVAEWADQRRSRLEAVIGTTTVLPVTNDLITAVAALRFRCRTIGHREHHADLWIAATAIEAQAVLVTADRVFRDVPGLVLA